MNPSVAHPVEPGTFVAAVDALPRPRLIVFDCDGVLAPIVAHADDAVLAPGTGDALAALAAVPGTSVAILSGRSLDGLAQFEFEEHVEVLGSYGAERRGHPETSLDADHRRLLDELIALAEEAAEVAGEGAWVERKPASVVLHVRKADPDAAAVATRRVRDAAERRHGVFVHPGKSVVELAVHGSDKGSALLELVSELAPASVVYLGDDAADEAAFTAIARGVLPGVSARVGEVETTAASHVLADPGAVTRVIELLATGT